MHVQENRSRRSRHGGGKAKNKSQSCVGLQYLSTYVVCMASVWCIVRITTDEAVKYLYAYIYLRVSIYVGRYICTTHNASIPQISLQFFW